MHVQVVGVHINGMAVSLARSPRRKPTTSGGRETFRTTLSDDASVSNSVFTPTLISSTVPSNSVQAPISRGDAHFVARHSQRSNLGSRRRR